MPSFLRVVYRVTYDALYHFTEDDGWAMASHVALSTLLALFPFLIFGTTLATFLGADRFSETAVHLIFDTWPPSIAKPISDEVRQVLTIPRGGLLTISVLAAAYFASNGVEALRVSLNRAYRILETRRWYVTRLVSLFWVLAAVLTLAAISFLLVAVPVALSFAEQQFPWLKEPLGVIANWRVYGTLLVLTLGVTVAHLWLPAGTRRLRDVLPGVTLTLIAWTVGALVFAYYIATFANYARTYAGLASLMIAIVFLYIASVIFIIGGEINAALLKYRVMDKVVRRLSGEPPDPLSSSDQAADI
jgi:membrane protein